MKNALIIISLFIFSAAELKGQSLVSISPSNATVGNSITALITGSGTMFMTGSPAGVGSIDLGFNCTSVSGTNISVVDDDHLNVDFTLPPSALNGVYNLNLFSNAFGSLTLSSSFTVIGGVDENVQTVSPSVLNAAATATILVSGQNIQSMITSGNFSANIVSGGNTIAGVNINIIDADHINVDFILVPYVVNGTYDLLINCNAGCFRLSGAIMVQGGQAQGLISIQPNQGAAGNTITALVTAQYLFFMTGSPTGPADIYLQGQGCSGSIQGTNISVTDDDHFYADFAIPSTAINGFYTLEVSQMDSLGFYSYHQLTNGFEVTGGINQGLVSINPYQGRRGETLSAIITSQNILFMTGTTSNIYIDFDNGGGSSFSVPASNTIVIDSNHVNTTISIPFNVPRGLYNLTLAYDGCTYLLPGSFEVTGSLITGEVYFDADSNGTKGGTEYGLPGKRVRLLPGSTICFTDTGGNYYFAVDSGIYSIEYLSDTNWALTSSPPVYSVPIIFNDSSGLDFGINPINDEYNMIVSLTGTNPHCFSNVNYQISCTNFSTVAASGVITAILDSDLSFVSSVPPPDVVNGFTYSWNYSGMPLHATENIVVTVQIPGTPGTLLNSYVCASIDTNSTTVFNSCDTLLQIVSCSFDPNDKSVMPEGEGASHQTLISDDLQYLIRFQNTGNDTAKRVIIIDTLDAHLDLNTLVVIASSHILQTFIHANNVVEFKFENIFLPDSIVDELHSHGFVKFLIRVKPGTSDPTVVSNNAAIYFDLNFPVITNSVFNTMVDSIHIGIDEPDSKSNLLIIYPNPISNEAIVVFNNPKLEKFVLKIFNSTGKLVEEKIVNSEQAFINRHNLSQGIYFILLEDEKCTTIFKGKFSIQ